MSRERLLKSRTIFQGKVFNVKRDEVEMPSGVRVIREVVEHPGAVAVVPLLDDETVVMIRQYRHPASKVLLEIPAGTLKKGEKPLRCARRELVEETGYTAKHLKKLLQCYLAPGYSSELIHIYLATELSKIGHKAEVDEFIDVLKVKIQEVLHMMKTNKIEDAKTICGMLAFISDYYRHPSVNFYPWQIGSDGVGF